MNDKHWHGKDVFFGLHYDLHAGIIDTEIGTRCSLEELLPMLQRMAPDFVQTDCKGHPGYSSWLSQTVYFAEDEHPFRPKMNTCFA
jgi:hypothetical protein